MTDVVELPGERIDSHDAAFPEHTLTEGRPFDRLAHVRAIAGAVDAIGAEIESKIVDRQLPVVAGDNAW